MEKNIICFDLEGPLSPQDNAYDVMGLFDRGHEIFEVISRYDDILTLEGREGYEPGNTLSLIVPFLIHHDISEKDIRGVSDTAKIVSGTEYMISRLKKLGWDPYIISTSYEQHAYNIGKKIGIPGDRISCTPMPLNKFRQEMEREDSHMIEEVEKYILEELHPPKDDEKIRERLDKFYYKDIVNTELGKVIREVQVVGGEKKVDAMKKIAEGAGKDLGDIAVVGDSITDYKMLGEVKSKGGISIVFNGNRYCLPYGNIALASVDIRFLLIIAEAYMRSGREHVFEVVREWEESGEEFVTEPAGIPKTVIPDDLRDFLLEMREGQDFTPPRFHCIEEMSEEKQENVVEIHRRMRGLVRGEASKLG